MLRRVFYLSFRPLVLVLAQVDSLVVNMETVQQGEQLALDAFPEPEAAFVEALNAIESAIDGRFNMWRFNNVYMNCLVDAHVEVKYVKVGFVCL